MLAGPGAADGIDRAECALPPPCLLQEREEVREGELTELRDRVTNLNIQMHELIQQLQQIKRTQTRGAVAAGATEEERIRQAEREKLKQQQFNALQLLSSRQAAFQHVWTPPLPPPVSHSSEIPSCISTMCQEYLRRSAATRLSPTAASAAALR